MTSFRNISGVSLLKQGVGVMGLLCVFWSSIAYSAAQVQPAATGLNRLKNLPLCFEAIPGQTGDQFQFTARSQAGVVHLGRTESLLMLRKVDSVTSAPSEEVEGTAHQRNARMRTLGLQFLGTRPGCQLSGVQSFPGTVNYFTGSDPARWRENVPSFSSVQVEEIYPGINLTYYGNQQQLEYDLVVAPGADPGVIAFRVTGADELRIDAQGDLILTVGENNVRQKSPIVYQLDGQHRNNIAGSYRLKDRQTVAFQIGDYDRRLPLVIDPILGYSSFLFGNLAYSTGRTIALDGSGNIYIAGDTFSPELAATNAVQGEYQGGYPGAGGDAFVAKFDSTGTNLVYLTYLGGNGDDAATSLAVDPEGNAYVTGVTDSTNFPIASATVSNRISGKGEYYFGLHPYDAFVAKLDAQGSQLLYSTYLGGSGVEVARGIALDSDRCAYVAGSTESTDFPAVNSLQRTNVGGEDVFVTKIASNGMSFVYSTYLGGGNDDYGQGIAVDGLGRVYVTGYTSSTNFPVSPYALQTNRPTAGSAYQVFLSLLASDGTSLVQSTYFGGTGDAMGYGIALDNVGNAYVTGEESGTGFPTTPGNLNPGGVFKSGDGAMNWFASSSNLLHTQIQGIGIDPVNPANLYIGTGRGIARSTNSGATWQTALDIFAQFATIAVDPVNPSTIYAGTTNVFKSTDAGVSWFPCSTGLVATTASGTLKGVNKLAVNPHSNATVYAATDNGVFKSINAATNWTKAKSGLPAVSMRDLALDSLNPDAIYVATSAGVFRSTNGGGRWYPFSEGLTNVLSATQTNVTPSAIATDSSPTPTVFVGTDEGLVFKRTAGDTNWTPIISGLMPTNGLLANNVTLLAVDPNASTTIYAGTRYGLFKSLDAGSNWNPVTNGLPGLPISGLAIDPSSSSTLYLATYNIFSGSDAFLTKFSPDLDAVIYSVTFGGSGSEVGAGVALDAAGDAFVVGSTTSVDFPTYQPIGYPFYFNSGAWDAFVIGVKADASTLLYSTYLGGGANDYGGAIALDAATNAWIVGQTFSTDFPIVAAGESLHRGNYGGFLSKIQMAYSLVNVTVQSDPPGVPVVVDGETYSNTPTAFNWPSGSFHILSAPPQSAVTNVRSAWISWSDGGEQTHRILVSGDATITASFKTQYYLGMYVTNLDVIGTNLQADATNGGAVSPLSGWYDEGTNLVIFATPPFGNSFNSWIGTGSGAYSGTNNPAAITMNEPITETAAFDGPITNRIKVVINGNGTVSPNYNGRSLQVGRVYTMTAKPASGYVFANWIGGYTSGGFTSTVPRLTFLMTNGLVFEANFVPSPFGPVQGNYEGLFYNTNVVMPQSSGFFRATVRSSGSFSAKLQLGKRSYSIAGQFSASGEASSQGVVNASLQLDLNGSNVLTGQISSNTAWSAEVFANRAVYSGMNPAPQSGKKYTLVIPGDPHSPVVPAGRGFGKVAVDASGKLTFSGALGDGTKVSQKTFVSAQGQWPFFASLYSGSGSILGWLTFADEPDSDINGLVAWFKLPVPRAKLYPGGFSIFADTTGSMYSFTNGTPLLNFGPDEGRVVLENGNLLAPITNRISLDTANKVTNLSSNKLSLKIKTSSGLFRGKVVDPATGKSIAINGALLQKQNRGDGYFINGDESGSVFLGP